MGRVQPFYYLAMAALTCAGGWFASCRTGRDRHAHFDSGFAGFDDHRITRARRLRRLRTPLISRWCELSFRCSGSGICFVVQCARHSGERRLQLVDGVISLYHSDFDSCRVAGKDNVRLPTYDGRPPRLQTECSRREGGS